MAKKKPRNRSRKPKKSKKSKKSKKKQSKSSAKSTTSKEKVDPVVIDPEVFMRNYKLEGPDATFCKIVSSDGHEFIMRKTHASGSPTLKTMLNASGLAGETDVMEIHCPEIQSHLMKKVLNFVTYKYLCRNVYTDFSEYTIPQEMALDLLKVANFFDV